MLSDVLGVELVRVRKAAGLTREQLAERCADLGWPALTTAAIGNLETGRRDGSGRRRREITVDELIVLSAALGIPSPTLLLPVLTSPEVEILPGQRISTAEALAWVRGDRPVGQYDPAAYAVLRLYVEADATARELVGLLGQWGPEHPPDGDPAVAGAASVQDRPPAWRELFRVTLHQARHCRTQLQAAGVPRPPLPPGLDWVDSPTDGGEQRAATVQ